MNGFYWFGVILLFLLAVSMGCARDRPSPKPFSSPVSLNSGYAAHDHGATPYAATAQASNTTETNVVQHKKCPVTGEPLDSMGGAISVDANGQTIFVCCQGCVKSVKQNSAKYLAIASSE